MFTMENLSSGLPPLQLLAPILKIESVAPDHYLFTLHAPEIARSARAGQFIHVLPGQKASFDPLLRRAFSIMAARMGENALTNENENLGFGEIDFLFRVQGRGTTRIADKKVGDFLDIIGPLGRPFDTSVFHVKQEQSQQKLQPILVGGGVGVPPMVFLSQSLKAAGLEPLMLIGARGQNEVLGLHQFKEFGVETRIATEDGTLGERGRITQLLERELQEIELQEGKRAVVYACGPLPMLRAVAALAARFDTPCQVSLEESMPCGIGICNGCVIEMKPPSGVWTAPTAQDYERYQRICVKGPAIWADEVAWEAV